MSGVIIKRYRVASIPFLSRLVLKKIFEPKRMTYDEEKLIEHSVFTWTRKINLTWREKEQLSTIVEALLKNEDNYFQKEKEFVARHKLDYRKVYRPGVPLLGRGL